MKRILTGLFVLPTTGLFALSTAQYGLEASAAATSCIVDAGLTLSVYGLLGVGAALAAQRLTSARSIDPSVATA